MADLKGYYLKLRTKRESLAPQFPNEVCWVISKDTLNTVAGAMHEVSIANAARMLTNETHRLATDAEIQAYLEGQQKEHGRLAKLQLDAARAEFNALKGKS